MVAGFAEVIETEENFGCGGLQPSELSYKKECQEKHLPFGSVPSFFSRHSAQLFERSHSMRAWSSSGPMSGFVSPPESAELSPCGPFPCCGGASHFLKPTSLTVIHFVSGNAWSYLRLGGLWLSWIVRGGIGFSPEAFVLKARSAPEEFG
jgi:hypothetical protein